MNHNIYFHNICSILYILYYVKFRLQTWSQSDLSFRSKPKVKLFKKSYLMNHKDIFTIFTSSYRSIIILHFIHRHDPNLTSPSGMNSLFMSIRRELYEASCTGSLCRVRDNSTHTKLDPRDNWPSITCHLPVKCQLMYR